MTPLERLLRRRVAASGPVTVAEFMALALGHPQHGYYRRRDPLGRAGDFVTAPEISQLFGEMIGLWCAAVWQAMGGPAPVRLVELGPGRGSLMADALRAARALPPFAAAIEVHLVETSRPLRRRQRQALAGVPVTWHDAFDAVPGGPLLLIANEFFDALPIRQFERRPEGWRERMVGLGPDEKLAFVAGDVVAPEAVPPAMRGAAEGAVAETCPDGLAIAARIGRRLAAEGGAALIVDYGPLRSAAGDSLQAVRRHAYHPVLAAPGEADLTAHVDFEALAAAARPAAADGPAPQGDWLRRLGIETRAALLAGGKDAATAAEIMDGCRRLIDPRQMGHLFKVMGLRPADGAALPGFESAPPPRPPMGTPR